MPVAAEVNQAVKRQAPVAHLRKLRQKGRTKRACKKRKKLRRKNQKRRKTKRKPSKRNPNKKKLKTVTIGSNVTSIGSSAFAGCTKLQKVTVGKT
ncbi:MAG: leucine-rich repeat protein [Firmicutes bacterium]|nr:leucine-rich repeat protein [Bacillota bacterium]